MDIFFTLTIFFMLTFYLYFLDYHLSPFNLDITYDSISFSFLQFVFDNGKMDLDKLKDLVNLTRKNRLTLDLSDIK